MFTAPHAPPRFRVPRLRWGLFLRLYVRVCVRMFFLLLGLFFVMSQSQSQSQSTTPVRDD